MQESYVRGDGSAALIDDTIGAYLDGVAEREGARLALVVSHQGVRWTYAELKARSDEFAAGFRAPVRNDFENCIYAYTIITSMYYLNPRWPGGRGSCRAV